MNRFLKIKIVILITVFITIISYLFISKNNNSQNSINSLQIQTKIKIAACPTCYKLGKKLDSQKYEIIPTDSTADSLKLLQNGQVDMVLAGRTLKPNEPQSNFLVIEEGYSFLSNKPITIYENELKNYSLFTDLDIEVIKEKFNVGKISRVDDVYQFINKGVIITSWENTDYTKAETVHLLKETEERVAIARRPTLYCSNVCGVEAQEIVNIINNNQKEGDDL